MFKASRITLLETTPAYRGYGDLSNFKRACFNDVFKDEPLPEHAPSTNIHTRSPVQPPVQIPVRAPIEMPAQASAQSIVQTPTISRSQTSPTVTSKPEVVAPSPSSTPVSATGSNEDTTRGMYFSNKCGLRYAFAYRTQDE